MLQSAQQLRQLVFPAWETCTQNARTVSSELIMYSPEILLKFMIAIIMLYNIIFHPTPGFVESIIIIVAVQTQLRLNSV